MDPATVVAPPVPAVQPLDTDTTSSFNPTTPPPNQNPNSSPPDPNPDPNTISSAPGKASRWTDGPSAGDANSEPPHKKIRNEEISGTGYGEGVPAPSYINASSSSATVTSTTTSYGYGGTSTTGYVNQTAGYLSYTPQYQNSTTTNSYGSFAPGSAKGTSALFYKTKLCTKFKTGTCTFNERCHFAHGTEDLRKPPPHWETLVSSGAAGGYNNSNSSTGQLPRVKTRQCRYFAEGNCPYGERCNFLHGNEELQKTSAASYGSAGGLQAPPASASQYQGYGAATSYSNDANVPGNMQYSNSNQGLTMSNIYGDSNASSIAPPYGAPADYTNSVAAQNVNPYSNVQPSANLYATSQDGANGASMNYNYWNAAGQAPSSMPSYTPVNQAVTQNNQTASWMHNYGTPGASLTHYNYPSGSQPAQPAANTHADGGYYQPAYGQVSYSNPQPDYAARYNMAEAWGGKVQ